MCHFPPKATGSGKPPTSSDPSKLNFTSTPVFSDLHLQTGSPPFKSRMNHTLSDTEVRVLGSLIEKEITTPDYYPLSLNALVASCNQTSNRNPVVHFDEATVARALDHLREK